MRVKLEMIFEVADETAARLEADRLLLMLREFRLEGRSRNAPKPFYDSLEISVERKSWEPVLEK